MAIEVQALLTAVKAIGPGSNFSIERSAKTLQATVQGNGAVEAKVVVEGSNMGEAYVEIVTFELAGTGIDSSGATSNSPWALIRARVVSVSPGAAVTVSVGY